MTAPEVGSFTRNRARLLEHDVAPPRYTSVRSYQFERADMHEAASGKAELQAGGALQELFLPAAASWKRARRVVAKVELHFGELFPRVGFIVTNFQTSSRAVVRFYNKSGTAEQVDKGGQAGGRDDTAFLPPLPR